MGQVLFSSFLDKLEKRPKPFALIKDHVLLPQASMLQEADALFKTILTPETLQSLILFLWNGWTGKIRTKALMQFRSLSSVLSMRLNHSQIFIKEPKMQEKHLYEYSVIRVVQG
jgi:hypothetical protein